MTSHLFVCGGLKVWQTQLIKMDSSVTWMAQYFFVFLVITACVFVGARQSETSSFILSDQINNLYNEDDFEVCLP